MNVRSAHAAYRQGQVGSAGPLQLVVLLYEGAIRFARRAQEAFDDPAVRGESLGRCHAIVTELLASLDRDRGGDVASNLDRLYRYVLEALTEANVDLDRGALASALRVLMTLGSGWQELAARGVPVPR